jgi:hypothetical protein
MEDLLIKLMMPGQYLEQGYFNNIIILNNHLIFFFFSAYCGGLNIAALRACVQLAIIMNDTKAADEYGVWLQLAKKSYSEKLWNG